MTRTLSTLIVLLFVNFSSSILLGNNSHGSSNQSGDAETTYVTSAPAEIVESICSCECHYTGNDGGPSFTVYEGFDTETKNSVLWQGTSGALCATPKPNHNIAAERSEESYLTRYSVERRLIKWGNQLQFNQLTQRNECTDRKWDFKVSETLESCAYLTSTPAKCEGWAYGLIMTSQVGSYQPTTFKGRIQNCVLRRSTVLQGSN